jgi:hypothetical protein
MTLIIPPAGKISRERKREKTVLQPRRDEAGPLLLSLGSLAPFGIRRVKIRR